MYFVLRLAGNSGKAPTKLFIKAICFVLQAFTRINSSSIYDTKLVYERSFVWMFSISKHAHSISNIKIYIIVGDNFTMCCKGYRRRQFDAFKYETYCEWHPHKNAVYIFRYLSRNRKGWKTFPDKMSSLFVNLNQTCLQRVQMFCYIRCMFCRIWN